MKSFLFSNCLLAVLCFVTACQKPSSEIVTVNVENEIAKDFTYETDIQSSYISLTPTPDPVNSPQIPEPSPVLENASVIHLLKRAHKNESLGFTGFALTQYQKVLTIDPENAYAKKAVEEYSIQARIDQEIGRLTRQFEREKKIWDSEKERQNSIREEIDSIRKRQHEINEAYKNAINRANATRNSRKRGVYLLRAKRLKDEYNLSKERIILLEDQFKVSEKKMNEVQKVIDQYQREVNKVRTRHRKPIRGPFPYDEATISPSKTPVNTPQPICLKDGVYRNY
jgi:hypothetical protein